jgi:hypothetical protein
MSEKCRATDIPGRALPSGSLIRAFARSPPLMV